MSKKEKMTGGTKINSSILSEKSTADNTYFMSLLQDSDTENKQPAVIQKQPLKPDEKKVEHKHSDPLNTLIIVCVICLIFMVAEVIGGLIANSLAILSDAAHMLGDLSGLLVAVFAVCLGRREADETISFGYHRSEVLGALASIVILWAITLWLLYEAVLRVLHPEDIDSLVMFITACLGLAVNILQGYILHKGGHAHGHGHGHCGHGHSHGNEHSHDHSHEHEHEHKHEHKQEHKHEHKHQKEHSHEHNHDHSHKCDHTHDQEHEHTHEKEHEHCHEKEHEHSHEHSHEHKPKKQKQERPQTLQEDEFEEEDECCHHQESDCQQAEEIQRCEMEDIEIISVSSFKKRKVKNVNVRAAFLHVMGDLLSSFGVVVAAAIIWINPDWKIADPLCTFVFSVIIFFTTFNVIRDVIQVLMEATPKHFNSQKLIKDLKSLPGVVGVHDFHVWSLSMGKTSLSAHLLATEDKKGMLALSANHLIKNKYGIQHSTIQIEYTNQKDLLQCVNDLHIKKEF